MLRFFCSVDFVGDLDLRRILDLVELLLLLELDELEVELDKERRLLLCLLNVSTKKNQLYFSFKFIETVEYCLPS